MKLELRKFTKFVDKTFIEGGKDAKEPVLMVSVAAVFKNPWHGQGFVEDLRPTILDLAPKLGDLLVPELIKEIGSPEKILAYGKAGVVGLNGEIRPIARIENHIQEAERIGFKTMVLSSYNKLNNTNFEIQIIECAKVVDLHKFLSKL